jgi:hypothetical protein
MALPMGACGFGVGQPNPKFILPIMTIFIANKKPAEAGFCFFLFRSGLGE